MKALENLPLPARALVREHINGLDRFRRQYPALYDVMFKNVDSDRYRVFERELERLQREHRRSA